MIFNKANNGANELRTLTGSYYKSNDFDKISVKVQLASEDITALIGKEIFEVAEEHYLSDNYQAPDPEPAPDGSTSGSSGAGIPARTYAILDELVQHIQLPIAFISTLWHYQGNDLSHEDSGRKNKIDDTSEKIAWEWQYDRDDAAALRNYHKAFDRLIKFLNENADTFPEWAESDARTNTLSLFINTAVHFNSLFPIDNSDEFFLRLAPIQRKIERKYIKPILGAEEFNALKEVIQSGDELDEQEQELYDYVCDPIPWLTMSEAVKIFSLQVLPDGVVQNYISDRSSRKASQPATLEQVNNIAKTFRADGIQLLDELKKYWATLVTDDSEPDIDEFIPGMEDTDKFISL